MKHKIRKFFLALVMLGGVVGLGACQKASHTARIPANDCEVRVVSDPQGKRTAVVTLALVNDTIYNVEGAKLIYNVYDSFGAPIATNQEANLNIFIRHGVAGYLSYTYNVEPGIDASYVKITDTKITKYSSLFETYLAPFVVMFTLAFFALLFFAIDLFRGGLTKEGVKELLRERILSSVVILCLALLICLIPLMFSSWVVTLILLGGFVGTGLLCGLLTLIRLAAMKHK